MIAIAAMAENRVIGAKNGIPWHLPEDFKWFKQCTTGHVIVMGRKTFESIGKPLPNRKTVILSSGNYNQPNTQTVHALSELKQFENEQVFICGGAQVYAQALPHCSELLLTHVKKSVEGDTYFPEFEDRFKLAEVIRDTPEFMICRYTNSSPALL